MSSAVPNMASWELARRRQRTAAFVPLLLSSASSCETLPFDDRTLRSIISYRGRVEDMGRQIHARYRDRPMRCAGHFFGGQLIEASVFVLGQIPRFAEVKCDIINGVLSSRYFPADLKARERGIRYKTGCAE
jgi:hypothetical protein